MQTEEIFERLVAFDTTSRNPNMDLMTYIGELLAKAGIEYQLIPDGSGNKANLYATVGPKDRPGVMLSGHTDVVPVDGQEWSKEPFRLTCEDGRYYGRGTADMKGFVACSISAALKASTQDLKTPLHLGFSYDEEIGCVGVRSMIELMENAPIRPAMCIVGEPTNLEVATGHKGKTGVRVTCTGREGHSALAPFAVNALYMANDLINVIRRLQEEVKENCARDSDYDVPYTTLHVGLVNGGVALNIVPNICKLSFEIRNLQEDDPIRLLDRVKAEAEQIVAQAREIAPEANIEFEVFNTYPGLSTPVGAKVVEFVKSLTGANGTCKVAFGTEGGLFTRELGIPTVICGPGSMAQGHKPDEYVSIEQIQRCEAMLDRLNQHLVAGIQD